MNTPIAPLIPPSGAFSNLNVSTLQVNNVNGQLQRGFFKVVTGDDVNLTALNLTESVLIRETSMNSTDVLPSPTDVANALGLVNPQENDSYIKQIIIYNYSVFNLTLSGSDWNFLGISSFIQYDSILFVYELRFVSGGWVGQILSAAKINND